MANNKYTVMSEEAIRYICGLIRNLANVSEGIDDLNLRSDGTFSSVKINTLLNTLKADCNEHTDRLVANLSRLELKLVTDESDITDSNILYLYKPDGATSYNQYVVIDGTKVLLGTCDINMGDYYTISQVDAKFALKIDLDTLTTSFNNLVTSVDKKIDKDKIVTALDDTATDEQVPSAKAVVDELDKKIEGDNVVKKDDIVTVLDNTVTDEQVASARIVYDKMSSIMSASPISYSLDEQLTGGTWIDGKPIYKKTVVCGALPNATSKYIEHGIDNIGLVIAMCGWAYSDPFTFIPLPFCCSNTSYNLELACNKTSVAFKTASNLSPYKESYVTIEYTKTTD